MLPQSLKLLRLPLQCRQTELLSIASSSASCIAGDVSKLVLNTAGYQWPVSNLYCSMSRAFCSNDHPTPQEGSVDDAAGTAAENTTESAAASSASGDSESSGATDQVS